MNKNRNYSKLRDEETRDVSNKQNSKRNASRRGKGKQRNSAESTNPRSFSKRVLEEASNNPALYKRFPELTRWATQIPINVISNLPAPLGDNTLTLPNIVVYGLSLISPCTPNSRDERNINLVQLSNDLYARMREDNSGAKNYDPPTITRLVFAMAGVFQRINFLQRIYGLINHTSAFNRAFPIMLFRAMHLDYNSFRDDQTNFAGRLDTIIVRAKDIHLVADIPILERIGMMYANYYIDTDDARDTLYIPCPGKNGFLDMDEYENLIFSDGPEGLAVEATEQVDNQSKLVTADTLLKDTENYLNKVLTSQDFGIVQGDIVRAFQGHSLTTLMALPDKLDLSPLNDKAMLMQYHNADIAMYNGYWKNGDNKFLAFDNNGLPVGNYELPNSESNPFFMAPGYTDSTTGTRPTSLSNNRFFNDYAFMCLDTDTVDPDWYIEVTRMKAGAGVDVITGLNVLLSIDAKLLEEMRGHITYTTTETDISNAYGVFPYNKYFGNYVNRGQHILRMVKIQDVTTQTVWNNFGFAQTFMKDMTTTNAGSQEINNNYMLSKLRTVCRYLPYSADLVKYYQDTAANTPIKVLERGKWMVDTFCPIVQPVPRSTMDMLSFICWKSLLSFPR